MNPCEAVDATPPRRSNRLAWAILALLVLGEYGLFRQFAEREVTWAPPLMHDQVIYLVRGYEIHETILREGPARGIWFGLREPTPNGVMLSLQGALLFLVLGASRLTALTLNFAYFAAFQVTVAAVLRWLRGWKAAFAGVGLVLAIQAPFFWAGGLMDFRIDWIALCLFGILLGLALRSNLFADWRWSALCGAAAAMLGLFRFITLVYLGLLGGAFVLVLLVRLLWSRRDAEMRRHTLRQFVGMTLATVIVGASCGPLLWLNRHYLHDYYVVGHLTGAERSVREKEAGIATLTDALAFYPRSVWRDHTGQSFVLLSAGLLAAAGALAIGRTVWRRWHRFPTESPVGPRLDLFAAYAAFGLALLVPLAILTLNPAKSPVVGSILVAPLLWLVLLTVIALGLFDPGRLPRLRRGAALLIAATAFATGLWVQATNLAPRGWMNRDRHELEQASALLDQIAQQCKAVGWSAPQMSSTNTNHAIGPLLAEVLAYEKQGIVLHVNILMPGSVLAVTEAQATTAISLSDFVILTRHRPPDTAHPYPFLESIEKMKPQLEQLCERSFWPLGDYCIYGEEVTLYRRPCLRVEGNDSDGTFSGAGLVLRGAYAELRRFPHVELTGHFAQVIAPPGPHVEAQLVLSASSPVALPARLTLAGDSFSIRFDVPVEVLPAEGEATIRLLLDPEPNTLAAGATAARPVLRKPVTVKLTPDGRSGATGLTSGVSSGF